MDTLHNGHYRDPDERLKFVYESLLPKSQYPVELLSCRVCPRFRASPVVRDLLKKCKITHASWKGNGSPGPDSDYYVERTLAKKNLRQQLRREDLNCKEHFYTGLMEIQIQKLFID